MLELKKYTSKNASYRLGIDILSSVELSSDIEQSQREKNFIEDICKRVQKPSDVLPKIQTSSPKDYAAV